MTLTRLFGERVYQLRLDAGLTRTQLARRCRVSTETIRKTEFGHGGEPGLVLILTVCGGLRVAPGALLAELPTPRERRP